MSYAVDPAYRPMMGVLPELDVSDAEKARAVIASMRTEDPMSAVPAAVEVTRRTAPATDGSGIELERMPPEVAARMRARQATQGVQTVDADDLVAQLELDVPVYISTAPRYR